MEAPIWRHIMYGIYGLVGKGTIWNDPLDCDHIMKPLGFWGAHPTNTCSGWWWWHFRHGDHFHRSFLGIPILELGGGGLLYRIRFPPQRPGVMLRTKRPHPWYTKRVHSPENHWSVQSLILRVKKKWGETHFNQHMEKWGYSKFLLRFQVVCFWGMLSMGAPWVHWHLLGRRPFD